MIESAAVRARAMAGARDSAGAAAGGARRRGMLRRLPALCAAGAGARRDKGAGSMRAYLFSCLVYFNIETNIRSHLFHVAPFSFPVGYILLHRAVLPGDSNSNSFNSNSNSC